MINIREVSHLFVKLKFEVRSIGIIREISLSKIRNKQVIKKKWREKGLRDFLLGLNPHSKGVSFSSFIGYLLRFIINRIDIIIIQTITLKVIIFSIIYIIIKLLNWKFNILFILYK